MENKEKNEVQNEKTVLAKNEIENKKNKENKKNIENKEKKKDKEQSKWGNLNYFNKFKLKNYVVTVISIILLYVVLNLTIDPNDIFSYTTIYL